MPSEHKAREKYKEPPRTSRWCKTSQRITNGFVLFMLTPTAHFSRKSWTWTTSPETCMLLVCVHAHVCVWSHMPVCEWRAETDSLFSSITLHLILCGTQSFPIQLDWQAIKPLESSSFPLPVHEFQACMPMPSFLHWIQGPELRFSGLQSDGFTQAVSPAPVCFLMRGYFPYETNWL